jgi:hypothetical protein
MKRLTFADVMAIGRTLPGLVVETRYDGASVLKMDGCFVAGLATHRSADPDTVVVRYPLEERDALLEEAADTYYVTEYYERYPLVLARLAALDRAQLGDLLSISRTLTLEKTARRKRGGRRR